MSMIRFVCAVSYYKNCREHDQGVYSDLRFYSSIKEFLLDVTANIQKHEFHTLYTTDGREVGRVLEYYDDICSGVTSVKAILRFVELKASAKEGWEWKRV